jgi:uncharacterized protein (TIGR02145 family)
MTISKVALAFAALKIKQATMRNCLLFLMLCIIVLRADAQIVRNVKATQEGQRIVIAYELVCAQPTEIMLFLSEDNGKTWNPIEAGVSGDVGMRIIQGKKVIYWDVLESEEKLVGNAFVFKVKSVEVFKTVKIGGQVWMADNLNVDHYRNGDAIREIKDAGQWSNLTSGSWCYYNSNISNGQVYGKLYNWYAVNDSRGLCPAGWHVPSDEDWTALQNFLGGSEMAGGKLKATTGWNLPNGGANNSSSYNGLPGGCRYVNGSFDAIGNFGYWWSVTENDYDNAWGRRLSYVNSDLGRNSVSKLGGFSVRCIKD